MMFTLVLPEIRCYTTSLKAVHRLFLAHCILGEVVSLLPLQAQGSVLVLELVLAQALAQVLLVQLLLPLVQVLLYPFLPNSD